MAATAPKPGAESEVEEMEGRLSLDWDGLSWSPDEVQVLPQGSYTTDVEVLLLRLTVKGAELLREEILDRGLIRVAVQVGPRIDECRAWARIAPGLGKGPDNRVLVHGGPLRHHRSARGGHAGHGLGEPGPGWQRPSAAMAHAAMHWTDPHPVTNVQGAGTALFLCLAASEGDFEKFRVCLDLGVNTFRKAGVAYDTRPYKNGGATRHPIEPWPDCRTIDPNVWVQVGCSLVLPPDQATDQTFKLRGTDNDAFSKYFFVWKVMLDLWETVSSVAAASGSLSDGELFAEKFPDVALKAFLLLDDEASFVDLRNAMRAASALSSSVAPHSPEIVAAIEDAFARHGIDATLESFCADEANEDFCH